MSIKQDQFRQSQIKEIITNQWYAFDELARAGIAKSQYFIILYLLILQRYSILPLSFYSNILDRKGELKKSVINYTGDYSKEIEVLYLIFEPIIDKIDYKIFDSLLRGFLTEDKRFYESFSQIVETFLIEITNIQGRESGEYFQPIELTKFIGALSNSSNGHEIYNPFAGIASFNSELSTDVKYFGQEIDKNNWAIGTMRLIASGKISNSEYIVGDSINQWNPFKNPHNPDESRKYDLIVSNPPLGMRLSYQISGNFGTIKSCEHFLIEKGIRDLKTDGKLITIVTNGFLYKGGVEQELRKYLIDNDLIETVISFPGGLFKHTAIPVSILVLNKIKKNKGVIHFVDAVNSFSKLNNRDSKLDFEHLLSVVNTKETTDISSFITNEEVSAFDYNLTVSRYLGLTNNIDINVNIQAIGSFATLIKTSKVNDSVNGKFVRIRDLKESKTDFFIDEANIEENDISGTAQLISESCLLLATRWKSLKPTYFEFQRTPIYVSSDIVCLKINENIIDRHYLISELFSEYVLKQIEQYRRGQVVPSISKQDLLNIKIQVPDHSEQKGVVKGMLKAIANEKKKEFDLFNKIHGLESEIQEQNVYLRHTLAGPTSNLKGALLSICKIMNSQVSEKVPDLMNLKVSDLHENTLAQYFEILERDIQRISNSVGRQIRVETEIEQKELYPIDIRTYLEKLATEIKESTNPEYEIDFGFDEEAFVDEHGELKTVYINANKDLLSDLIYNLISNAEKHAFNIPGKHRFEIYMMMYNEPDSDHSVQVLISNTGKSFPENFTEKDFIKKGSKAGINGGDGFGGWYINEIIKKMNGYLDIIDERGPEGMQGGDLATSFEITFPMLEITDNEEL